MKVPETDRVAEGLGRPVHVMVGERLNEGLHPGQAAEHGAQRESGGVCYKWWWGGGEETQPRPPLHTSEEAGRGAADGRRARKRRSLIQSYPNDH